MGLLKKIFQRAEQPTAEPVKNVSFSAMDRASDLLKALSTLSPESAPLKVHENRMSGSADQFSLRIVSFIPIDQQAGIKQALKDMNHTLGPSITFWSENDACKQGGKQVVFTVKPSQMDAAIEFIQAYAARPMEMGSEATPVAQQSVTQR